MSVTTQTVRTKIPARMDRLPWVRWHWLVVVALGTVWILDGLEVTIKGAVGPSLREALGFTTVGVAGVASIYLLGAISGALFWAYLTDRYGRKRLFIITLVVYMVGVIGTSLTGLWILGDGFEYVWFAIFRFITGFGIGGEYAAINSAIDELIPARVRGWVDLAINGSWWVGTAFGAVLGALYLNIFPVDVAFRVAFGMGALLAIAIMLLRLFVPESPRWLMTHGYEEEAEETVRKIEADVVEQADVDSLPEPDDEDAIELRERRSVGFVELGRTLFKVYPRRSGVGFAIMATQAFLYNAIFFTFGLMLTEFFAVNAADVGWFLLPFAVGNYMGPLVLGRFFDTAGRRVMIPLTFWTAGALTILAGYLFATEVIGSAWLMTLAWVIIFFFASAAASSGYLTVSETFPLEVRAMAIAFFYAIATAAGGIIGPILFGTLITGDRWTVFWGYVIGGVLMGIGGLVHRIWGVEAAQMELEDVAAPLSAEEAEREEDQAPELSGPGGVDPGDPDSIRRFQQEHDLPEDGVIGPATAGALRALIASGDAEAGELRSVDVTDVDSIRSFQRDHGLAATGAIDRETAGAIRAAERRELLDPADPESVRAFQHRHELREDGRIGPDTQAALKAVRAGEGGTPAGFVDVNPLDRESVERFQRACGLEPDGVIGAQTRGALRVERAIRARNAGVDAADRESVARFQREHDLEPDGVIGPRTQEALLRAREDVSEEVAVQRGFGVDPADAESVMRFQREVELEADGAIGPRTRRAMRRYPHLLLEIDPTDEDAVKRFQAEHDLEADGVIGPQTQGALRALMRERVNEGRGESDDDEEDRDLPAVGGLLGLDPADPESVREFQREHGLTEDGVIGRETRVALRAAATVREEELIGPPPEPEGPARPFRRRPHTSGLTFSAHLPERDRALARELGAIESTLRDHGSMSRDALRDAVDARHWGPGRFRYVLRAGEEEGVVRRVGRGRYALRR